MKPPTRTEYEAAMRAMAEAGCAPHLSWIALTPEQRAVARANMPVINAFLGSLSVSDLHDLIYGTDELTLNE